MHKKPSMRPSGLLFHLFGIQTLGTNRRQFAYQFIPCIPELESCGSTWRRTGKHGSSAPQQRITQPTSWPYMETPTWSSTEQVARPAKKWLHRSIGDLWRHPVDCGHGGAKCDGPCRVRDDDDYSTNRRIAMLLGALTSATTPRHRTLNFGSLTPEFTFCRVCIPKRLNYAIS